VRFYFQTYIHSPIDGAVALIIFLNKEAPTVISITMNLGAGRFILLKVWKEGVDSFYWQCGRVICHSKPKGGWGS